jgi:hypothetical protein
MFRKAMCLCGGKQMNAVAGWRKCPFDNPRYQRMIAKYENGQFQADHLFFHACRSKPGNLVWSVEITRSIYRCGAIRHSIIIVVIIINNRYNKFVYP